MQTLMERFNWAIDLLQKVMHTHGHVVSAGREYTPETRYLFGPNALARVLHWRLRRVRERVVRLFERWKAGELPKAGAVPRARRVVSGDTEVAEATESTERSEGKPKSGYLVGVMPDGSPVHAERLRTPSARMWLVKRVQAVALPGTILRDLANEAEMRAFLSEVPQAARMIRRWIWLSFDDMPEVLRLPKRKRKPRPRKTYPEIVLSEDAIRCGARVYPGGWVD